MERSPAMRSTILLLLAAACLAASAPVIASEPTADDLIKLAPVLDSSDPKCRSIEFSGCMKGGDGVLLKFRSTYLAPGQHALFFSDGFDDTPILLVADRKIMFYDPVIPAILLSDNISLITSVKAEGEKLKLDWDFQKSKAKTERIKTDLLRVDLKSILDGDTDREVIKTGENNYRLILAKQAKEPCWVEATFDITKPSPCTSIRMIERESHEAVFCFDRIILNGNVGGEEFRFPAKDRLPEHLKVKDWPGDGFLANLGGLAMVTRACYARAGANHPSVRKSIKLPGLWGIHWDQIKANDAKYSAVLKRLIPSADPKPTTALDPRPQVRESTGQLSPPAERLTGLGGPAPK
jgi:hypothetical protein